MSSPSASPAPSPGVADNRMLIVGVILAGIGLTAIAAIIFFVTRLRTRTRLIHHHEHGPRTGKVQTAPRRGKAGGGGGGVGSAIWKDHPAARITPFGSPGGETPRFYHTPGEGMRIASRRNDGVWEFGDPRAPFTPSGISELEHTPSPSSSSILAPWRRRGANDDSGSTISYSSTSTSNWKSREKERERLAEKDKDNKEKKAWSEYDSEVIPPPAYAYGREWDDGLSPGSATTLTPTPSTPGSGIAMTDPLHLGHDAEREGGYLQQSRFSL